MYRKYLFIIAILSAISACNPSNNKFDASGTFEVNEVVVSSEIAGKILSLPIQEGDTVALNKIVGAVDAENLSLQKEQVEASIQSLSEKKSDVSPQVRLLENQLAVQQSQLTNLLHEKSRFENLFKRDAATGKQVDDINAQIDLVRRQIAVTGQQINVQRNNVETQNRSIMSEAPSLKKKADQISEQIKRANIVNPVAGTVITKYSEEGEFTSPGKAIYKIANLKEMTLRAYISGDQFSQVKLGQVVKVFVDDGSGKYRELPGKIIWISDKAEFTPKTIQTRDERANLVYAVKILVKNDGYLKIGMYGEVNFN